MTVAAVLTATPRELTAVLKCGPVVVRHGSGSTAGQVHGAAWYPCYAVPAGVLQGLTIDGNFTVVLGPEGTSSPAFLDHQARWSVSGAVESIAWLRCALFGYRKGRARAAAARNPLGPEVERFCFLYGFSAAGVEAAAFEAGFNAEAVAA